MFQYALGYYLKSKTGNTLCLDYSLLKTNEIIKKVRLKKGFTPRKAMLEYFFIDEHKVRCSILTIIIDWILQKIFGKGFTGKSIAPIVQEKGNCRDNNSISFDSISDNDNVIICGYWQNIDYIEPIKQELSRQFQINIETDSNYKKILYAIKECESVGVHIRRGDYVALGWAKNETYYKNAINNSIDAIPNAHFFFFSDDIDWVKQKLSVNQDDVYVTIAGVNADLQEFALLMNCKHQIISDSTFGWWAAYLNPYKQKKVFIPYDVLGNIWPKEWERIQYSI